MIAQFVKGMSCAFEFSVLLLLRGCEIVLTCDMVVASTASSFGVPEVKRSLTPGKR